MDHSQHSVAITWNWGVHETVAFDPSHQVLDFGWVTGEYFTVAEVNGSVVISLPLNQHSYTLTGITLDELTIANIVANDPSTFTVWEAALADGGEDPGEEPGHGANHVVTIGWDYGVHAVVDFDPSHQVLDFGWVTGEYFTVTEVNGSVVISLPLNQHSYTLTGVTLDELTIANIMANDPSTFTVWAAALADGGEDPGEDPGDGPHVVTIGWDYGVHETVAFDPSHQMLDFGWVTGEYFTVTEVNGSVVISLPLNLHSYTLTGVTLDELTIDHIMANDPSTFAVWEAALAGGGEDPGEDPGHGHGEGHIVSIMLHPGMHMTVAFDVSHQVLDFGAVLGSQFQVEEVNGSVVISLPGGQTYTLTGVTLDSMSMANVTGDDASVLDVWTVALGEDETPVGPDLPPGGTLYAVTTTGADIVGFDPATDRLNLGEVSVHVFIPVDTPDGLGFMNPWNGNIQVVEGINLAEMNTANFSPVSNNHLREDLSGALAWERGIVEQPNTVYARSHELNRIDRVEFDAATDTVDFRYYGTRELISMLQTDEGVMIANGGTGQRLVLLHTTLDELSGRNFIFHMGQVYEDHLDQQLGITFDPANVWSRVSIPDAGTGTAMGASDGQDGYAVSGVTTRIEWGWGTHTVLDFDPSGDRLDFGFMTTAQYMVEDNAAGILISLVGNNRTYLLDDLDLADLSIDNILAAETATLASWLDHLS
ncbi:hypothetical protein STVA_26250 [Allostella vacuolata]|nr:hypothetical protein STVA_26250 [Stella vacuolata]